MPAINVIIPIINRLIPAMIPPNRLRLTRYFDQEDILAKYSSTLIDSHPKLVMASVYFPMSSGL